MKTLQQNMRADYLWNTVGVFAQTVISPLLIIAVTRINGIDDSGIVSYAFAVALIIWAISSWGGRTYQVSDSIREFDPRSYILVRMLLGSCVLIASLAFCAVNGYDPYKSAVLISLVIFKVLESIADAVYGVLQTHNHLYIAGKSMLYKALLGFLIFVTVDIYTRDVLLSSLGFIVANLLFFLLYDIPHAKMFEAIKIPRSRFVSFYNEAKRIIVKCSPIATIIILSMFSLNIPRYFLDLFHESQVGYYGILVMPITVIGLFIAFILQPNVVKLTDYYASRKIDRFESVVKKILLLISAIGVGVAIVTYLIGVELLEFVFGISFAPYKAALMILILGAIFNACVMIYVNIFTITRHFKVQFIILTASNVLLTIACLWVVREYGLTGGVALFTTANAIQLLLLAYYYKLVVNGGIKPEAPRLQKDYEM